MRRVDVRFGTARRRMPQNTLDDQNIHTLIVKVRGQAVPQGMAGDVKRRFHQRVKQDFFKIVFHGADGRAIALLGDKQSLSKPAVTKLIP